MPGSLELRAPWERAQVDRDEMSGDSSRRRAEDGGRHGLGLDVGMGVLVDRGRERSDVRAELGDRQRRRKRSLEGAGQAHVVLAAGELGARGGQCGHVLGGPLIGPAAQRARLGADGARPGVPGDQQDQRRSALGGACSCLARSEVSGSVATNSSPRYRWAMASACADRAAACSPARCQYGIASATIAASV